MQFKDYGGNVFVAKTIFSVKTWWTSKR